MAAGRPGNGLRTALGLPLSEKLFAAEALFWLVFASSAIAVLPFRTVAQLASRPITERPLPPEARKKQARRVAWAVGAWAGRVPWRALCFQQGLAAHIMLRRRGADTVMYYGATRDPEQGLSAHVWVRQGDLDVIGCEGVQRYGVLATFPGNHS